MIELCSDRRINFDEFETTLTSISDRLPSTVITEEYLKECGVPLCGIELNLVDTVDMEQYLNLNIREQNVKDG